MLRHLTAMTLLTLLLPACLHATDTLSVVPLAKALQNPALSQAIDDSDKERAAAMEAARDTARETVRDLLWNTPETNAELEVFHARLAEIARHRDTRVGKLFFAALSATPDVGKLPAGTQSIQLVTRWPLALEATLQVRVEHQLHDGVWKIAALELTVNGVAAAPVSGLAPYFGEGKGDVAKLDFQPIDYLVGRPPADHQLPESERSDFDFDAALQGLFASEPGAYSEMLDGLAGVLDPDAKQDFDNRLAALKPHLAGKDEVQALEEADAKSALPGEEGESRVDFWQRMFEELEKVRRAPHVLAMPEREGARVEIDYVTLNGQERGEGTVAALRLANGEIAPRGALQPRAE